MLCVEVYAGQNQKEAAVVSSTRHNRKIRKASSVRRVARLNGPNTKLFGPIVKPHI